MTCEKCTHKYLCVLYRKITDAVFQEGMLVDTKRVGTVYSAVASICNHHDVEEVVE